MSDFREEETLGKAYDSRIVRRLVAYMRPYKWTVFFALILTLAVAPLEAAGPYLFSIGVDRYIVPVVKHALDFNSGIRGLILVTLGFLGSLMLSFAVQYVQVRVM